MTLPIFATIITWWFLIGLAYAMKVTDAEYLNAERDGAWIDDMPDVSRYYELP